MIYVEDTSAPRSTYGLWRRFGGPEDEIKKWLRTLPWKFHFMNQWRDLDGTLMMPHGCAHYLKDIHTIVTARFDRIVEINNMEDTTVIVFVGGPLDECVLTVAALKEFEAFTVNLPIEDYKSQHAESNVWYHKSLEMSTRAEIRQTLTEAAAGDPASEAVLTTANEPQPADPGPTVHDLKEVGPTVDETVAYCQRVHAAGKLDVLMEGFKHFGVAKVQDLGAAQRARLVRGVESRTGVTFVDCA